MKTLKLDFSYRPVGVIDCLEALVMCIIGKAVAVEEYEEEISSPSVTFKIPSVIVLKRVVKFINNTLHVNRNNIFWRDKNQCQYCGIIETPKELTLDHVVPKSRVCKLGLRFQSYPSRYTFEVLFCRHQAGTASCLGWASTKASFSPP